MEPFAFRLQAYLIKLIVRTESGDPELSFSDAAIGLGFL